VDGAFPRLTNAGRLPARLAWDRERFQVLKNWYEKRRAEVIQWEVDEVAEAAFYQGEHEVDPDRKLEAWKADGERLGYRLESASAKATWSWFDAQGVLKRDASWRRGDGESCLFERYHLNKETSRREVGIGRVDRIEWSRENGTRIRTELGTMPGTYASQSSWGWSVNRNSVRHESDDNGDRIPDFVWTNGSKERRPLDLADSWAVHPELIPPDLMIPDQPQRRLPIRRIPLPTLQLTVDAPPYVPEADPIVPEAAPIGVPWWHWTLGISLFVVAAMAVGLVLRRQRARPASP
jgi:hypothetical protein